MDPKNLSDWHIAEALADTRSLFVLWCIHDKVCRNLQDFAIHYGSDFSVGATIEQLLYAHLLLEDQGNFTLSRLGRNTIEALQGPYDKANLATHSEGKPQKAEIISKEETPHEVDSRPVSARVSSGNEAHKQQEVSELSELILGMRSGDRSSLSKFFNLVSDHLKAPTSRLLRSDFPKVGLREETEDVLHDVIIRLVSFFKQADLTANITQAYFYGVCASALRRTILDLSRKHFGRLKLDDTNSFEGLEGRTAVLQKSSGLDQLRSRLRVHELIEHLTSEDREVIELALYAQLQNREIAKLMDISMGEASRRLFRAKERLGLLLSEDEKRGSG